MGVQLTGCRPVGSNYRLGGGAHIIFFTDWGGGGGHTSFFFKMTDLCNEQYSIFVQIIGGGGGGGGTAPRAPLFLRPWDGFGDSINWVVWAVLVDGIVCHVSVDCRAVCDVTVNR